MSNKWKKIAEEAGRKTDEQFAQEISSLTRVNDEEILEIIDRNNISKTDLAEVLTILKDATKSNEEKAKAITNIGKGVDAIVDIVIRLL